MVKLARKCVLRLLLVAWPCRVPVCWQHGVDTINHGRRRWARPKWSLLWRLGSETARALYTSPQEPHGCPVYRIEVFGICVISCKAKPEHLDLLSFAVLPKWSWQASAIPLPTTPPQLQYGWRKNLANERKVGCLVVRGRSRSFALARGRLG